MNNSRELSCDSSRRSQERFTYKCHETSDEEKHGGKEHAVHTGAVGAGQRVEADGGRDGRQPTWEMAKRERSHKTEKKGVIVKGERRISNHRSLEGRTQRTRNESIHTSNRSRTKKHLNGLSKSQIQDAPTVPSCQGNLVTNAPSMVNEMS